MLIINSKHIIFKNIVDSLYIYFREKGFKCIVSEKIDYNKNDIYIFVGINKLIKKYPYNYIIYQFEQINSYYLNEYNEKEYNYIFNEEYFNILKNAYQVWDYSIENIEWLQKNFKLSNLIYIPICYSSMLNRKIDLKKDIDILFFGSVNNKRRKILDELKKENIYIVIKINDCWDEELEHFIFRSKIILNIHYYENAILEMHRLSFLLNNKCFILSETVKNKDIIEKYKEGIIFEEYDKLVSTSKLWLEDERRDIISINGFNIFKKENYDNYINIKKNMEKSKKKIKKEITWYKPSLLLEIENEIDIEGNFSLKFPPLKNEELPFISIITPTRNRKKLFSIAIKNFKEINYPFCKLEWIIVDDGEEDLSDMLLFSSNIKYYKIEKVPNIGKKRNICVEKCSYNYIACMDDDDYYPSESILARVKTILKYPHIGCVGCNTIGLYDLYNKKSYLASDGPKYFSEASMLFTKSFWKERNFNEEDKRGEGKYFLEYREHLMLSIPFQFVIIALKHKTNSTEQIRNLSEKQEIKKYNLFDTFNSETQLFFNNLILFL